MSEKYPIFQKAIKTIININRNPIHVNAFRIEDAYALQRKVEALAKATRGCVDVMGDIGEAATIIVRRRRAAIKALEALETEE